MVASPSTMSPMFYTSWIAQWVLWLRTWRLEDKPPIPRKVLKVPKILRIIIQVSVIFRRCKGKATCKKHGVQNLQAISPSLAEEFNSNDTIHRVRQKHTRSKLAPCDKYKWMKVPWFLSEVVDDYGIYGVIIQIKYMKAQKKTYHPRSQVFVFKIRKFSGTFFRWLAGEFPLIVDVAAKPPFAMWISKQTTFDYKQSTAWYGSERFMCIGV